MPSLIVEKRVVHGHDTLGQTLLTLEQASSSTLNTFGVLIEADTPLKDLTALLPKLNLIAIKFQKIVDGRGYSLAYLLRERLKFTGQIRAIGEFTRDQLLYLDRVGFDAMTLRDGEDAEAAITAFNTFTVRYQTSHDVKQPLFRQVQR